MTEPELDADGYPTAKTLKAIRNWNPYDTPGLMRFVEKAWHYGDIFFSKKNKRTIGLTEFKISTGGWSGNESVISALQKNHVFWGMCWESSHRGGHYVFTVPNSIN